jgi:hypothetical protein
MYQTGPAAPENLNILLETKDEYTRQFINITRAPFVQGMISIYESVKAKNKQHKFLLKEFQHALKNIPQWSQFILQQEEQRFKQVTGCDWMEELMKATFVANIHILAKLTNKSSDDDKSLHVEIPSLKTFIHNAYISIARCIWKKPFLMYHKVSKIDYQKNMTELEAIVEQNIKETFRQSLPYKELIGSFLEGSINRKDINHVARQAEHLMKQFDDHPSPPSSPKPLSRVHSSTDIPVTTMEESVCLADAHTSSGDEEPDSGDTRETEDEVPLAPQHELDLESVNEHVKVFSMSDESDTDDADADADSDTDTDTDIEDDAGSDKVIPCNDDSVEDDHETPRLISATEAESDVPAPPPSLTPSRSPTPVVEEHPVAFLCEAVDDDKVIEVGVGSITEDSLPASSVTHDALEEAEHDNDDEGIKKIDIREGGHRKKKRPSSRETNEKIKKYLGIDISWKELAGNSKQIRKMLLQKSAQRH